MGLRARQFPSAGAESAKTFGGDPVAQDKDLSTAKRRAASELTRGLKPTIAFLFLMSGLISVLALTGSIYMMQVYDRAITSGSVPTLLALSILALGLYLFQGFFDTIRSQVLVRVGARLDKKLAPLAHKVAIEMPRFGFSTSESLERGRDVDTVRSFLGGQGPTSQRLVVLGLVYVLALLMVSNVRYYSFKDVNVRAHKPFFALVAAIILFKLVILEPQIALFAAMVAYVSSGPVSLGLSMIRRHRRRASRLSRRTPDDTIRGASA